MRRILRLVLVLAVPLLLTGGGATATAGCSSVQGSCCRVCDQGKACGDTCIEATDTCTAGAGCACNG